MAGSLPEKDAEELSYLFSIKPEDTAEKVRKVKEIFIKTGSASETQKQITYYTEKAFTTLEKIEIAANKKQMLRDFGSILMTRTT